MNNVYPSTSELIPPILRNRIPGALEEDIKQRYAELGPKYLTEQEWSDGRAINACMHKNSIQDALEEIIDAVFNVLVWIFKHRRSEGAIPATAYDALMGLIELYALLSIEKERDPIA